MKKYLTILFLFWAYLSNGQANYNPSIGVTVNQPIAQGQQWPTDARSYKYDSINFLWRPYQNTTEVKTYLNLSKYRAGNFVIVVDSGGSLQSNGTYIGGINNFWMFRNGTADSNLVELNLFGLFSFPQNIVDTLRGLTDSTFSFTQLNGITNTIKIRGNTQSGNVSSITLNTPSFLFNTPTGFVNTGGNWAATLNLATVSPNAFLGGPATGSPATPTYRFLTTADLPTGIPNGNLLNSIINLSLGTSGTQPNFGTSTVALGGILQLNIPYASPTTNGIITDSDYVKLLRLQDTIFAKSPLYVPPGTPDSVAIYLASAHQQGALDSLDWVIFNNKQRAIQFSLGTSGQIDSLVLGTNLTATLAGNTYTLNANNAATNNIKWLDTGNHVIAGIGVGTVYKADTGIRVTLSGDTIKLRVIPDTIYAGSGLGSTGTDTLLWGGSVSRNTTEEFHGLYSLTLDSLGAGLFMTQLANKSTLLSTDSVLINDVSGKAWKVPSSAIGGGGAITGATNGLSTFSAGTLIGLNGVFSQNNTELTKTFALNLVSDTSLVSATLPVLNVVQNEGGSVPAISASMINNSLTASSGPAILGTNNFGTGVQGVSSDGFAVVGNSTTGIPAFFSSNASGTNTVAEVLRIQRNTNASLPTAGAGSSINFGVQGSTIGSAITASIISTVTRVSALNQSGDIELWTFKNGTNAEVFNLDSNGKSQLNNYTTGNHLATAGDTTNFKPMSVDGSGNQYRSPSWYGGSGGGGGNTNSNIGSGYRFAVPSTNNIKTLFCSGCTLDSTTNTNALTLTVGGSSFTRQVYTSGTTVTVSAGNSVLTVDPTSTIAALAVTLVASPSDLQVVKIEFGGTLTSGIVITALSILPNSGQTIIDNTPPTSATADNFLEYQYRSSTSQWYRRKP